MKTGTVIDKVDITNAFRSDVTSLSRRVVYHVFVQYRIITHSVKYDRTWYEI